MSTPFSAGGIYSTVEDMYSWNEALSESGKLLSADSLKQMFTEYPEATHEGQHYGYGVVISRLKFGRLLTTTEEALKDFPAASNAIQTIESASSYCQTSTVEAMGARRPHRFRPVQSASPHCPLGLTRPLKLIPLLSWRNPISPIEAGPGF